jgi:hypothetical protein
MCSCKYVFRSSFFGYGITGMECILLLFRAKVVSSNMTLTNSIRAFTPIFSSQVSNAQIVIQNKHQYSPWMQMSVYSNH